MEIKVQATQAQLRKTFKEFIHKLNKQYGLSYLDMKSIIEEAAWWEQKYNQYNQYHQPLHDYVLSPKWKSGFAYTFAPPEGWVSEENKTHYKVKYTTSNPIGEKIDGKQQHTEGVCSGESSVPTQQCEQSQQASGSSDSF